jgi:hypothetical protein
VLANNLLRKDQLLIANTKPLPAITNVDGYDTKNISGGQLVNGGVTIPVTMKKGEAQLCLLVKNEKMGTAMLKITYDKIVQEFAVDWQRWGWVPISLLKQFSEGEHVDVTIEATGREGALTVKKYFIRSVNNGYTD